jgi:putative ABC transport system ATP-binding protein
LLVTILTVPVLQQRVNAYVRRSLLLMRHVAQKIVHGFKRPAVSGDRPLYGPTRTIPSDFRMIYRLDFLSAVWNWLLKFVVNLLMHLHALAIYVVGGYLVLKGDVTLGALVAALAAFGDMRSPLRELVQYYQEYSATQVRYVQIKRRFDDPDGLMAAPE